MKALLLAATSSLALTGFAMAQTGVETGTSGAAATPPAAGSTATDSSAAATTGAGSSSEAGSAGVAAGGADASGGTGAGDAASGTTSGSGMATGTTTDAATGMTTDAATGTGDTSGSTGAAGMSPDAATGATGSATDSSSTMGTAAGTDATATTTTTESTTVTATHDAGAPAMSADHPGMLGSWIMNRRIWTTNQPSSTEWADTTLSERPAEWTDIAKVDDIVVDVDGNIMGYVADIGGFLGLGAKQVLLNKDALHFVQIGDDAFFATNFTREELEALPDFDSTTVMR